MRRRQSMCHARCLAELLGLLVGVKAVRLLQALDLGDVALLGRLGRDALVDNLLPRALLGLALQRGGNTSWGHVSQVSSTAIMCAPPPA
jgi:hypothetical protein